MDTPKVVIIPAGTGYFQEYNGNINGDFRRATEDITTDFELYHGASVIFKLPSGKRGITQRSLVRIE